MKKLIILCVFFFSIGIYSQFNWQQINGPQGGIVSEIKSNSSGILFMGSLGGGMFRSFDNGITWQQKVNGFPGPVFDDGTVTFAIANDGDIFSSCFIFGVFRSTNNGESWINTNIPNSFITGIVIDQSKRVYAAAGGGTGVLVTSNNGLNWVQKNNGLPVSILISTICLTAAGELFIGSTSGNNLSIYKSTNYAESWDPGTQVNTYPVHIVSFGSYIFSASHNLGVYRSTNSGSNWIPVNSGLTNKKINRLFVNNNQILAASDSGVFRSTNNGDNWFNIGFSNKRITEVNITPSGAILVAVTGGGIFRTTNNGINWVNSSGGFNCNAVFSTAFSGSNIYAGLAYNGLMWSSDNGNNWIKITNGFKGTDCRLLYTAPNGYIFAQSDSGLYRTTNNGNNWVMVGSPYNRFNAIIRNQNGHLFASASSPSYGVWRSTDNGASWDMPDPNFHSSLYTLCISPGGILFAGSSGGGVYRSTNGGVNWIQSQPYAVVHSLTSSLNGYIFGHFDVSMGQIGIYRSTNNGVNWQYMNFGNNDYYLLKSNTAGHIFAGGVYGAGFYRSTNNGVNWHQTDDGIYNRMITSISFDNSGFAYAGTYYGGIYKTNISTIGLISLSTEIPNIYSLSQNYPNPFNPVTNIEFALPKSAFVKLTVFDILGRVVETLINEELKAGTYKAEWNAANYPSGIYFYKIISGGFAETKKMILVK